ncbi:hypothetical protein [Acetonema longum]|uniref:Uncharacterized protein n=1 Tax=Acetonema longum DSM 6540 TaxID=1009370 RepID=F7NM15_9FIRM|nr:hypothetical protein [Acetonema longum]EGO62941.1 hypothetical protein ALO_15707 [Acetonema longum DSM 6540]
MRKFLLNDVTVLLVVSVIAGSLLAGAISYGANAYFAKTISDLVGDYGEFDLLIQVREEAVEDATAHIQAVIQDYFPGARLKQSVTIPTTGKTPIFIALPEEFKTQKVYENIDATFAGIPGGAGVSIMTEPRLAIRGVPEGAKPMLTEYINQLEGVRFSFRDGASIGVILKTIDKLTPVTQAVNDYLKRYQIMEISFPVGNEAANPVRTGDLIAAELISRQQLKLVQNVSVNTNQDDMAALVSTMLELKRFLSNYASAITLTPTDGAKFRRGDVILFQGQDNAAPAAGAEPDRTNVLIEVTTLRADGKAEGRITQGDAQFLTNLTGYRLDQEKNLIGQAVAEAAYRNPRQDLAKALTELVSLAEKIPGMVQDAKTLSRIGQNALNQYGGALNALERTLAGVESAGTAIQAATGGLAGIDTARLETQLDNSSKAVGNLINTLQVLQLLQGNATNSINDLTTVQNNLTTLRGQVAALGTIARDAQKAKAAIDSIIQGGQNTLSTLRSFNAAEARSSLADANQKLDQLAALNVALISSQLQYLAAAAPQMKDEEIYRSIRLLDNFIAGQVIPGAKIQLLTTGDVTADSIMPVVQEQVGHSDFSLYSTAMGVIEPNPRGELYAILLEVKAILAGMTAIIVTILLLGLDHSAIMTFMRRQRLARQADAAGWRRFVRRFRLGLFARDKVYGMAVGAILLTGIFALAGGGIPYLPWIGVPVVGAVLGYVVSRYAERISPVSGDEVLAGEALGLSAEQIIREIVIPSGRPGLMEKLNHRKMKLRGGHR